MFTQNQEEYLLRRLNRNEVVLFTGSGFSFDAINSIGENMPIGKSLSKKIFEFVFPNATYIDDGTSLADMYQAMLNSGKSNEQIKDFLSSNLQVKSLPDYYKYTTLAFWFKIYTINIDNLLDKIYERWSPEIKLTNLIFPKISYQERDQLLDTLQAIYLHGKIPCDPNEVIFSRSQYANRAIKLQPLYFHFIQDFSTCATVFIGTTLDEQLFEQYIATRQSINEGVVEHRPKSFLIIPNISVVREKILKDEYNIEVIKGSTEEFLKWLASKADQLTPKHELLKKLLPSLEKLETHPKYKDYFSHNVKEFAQSFQKVEVNKRFSKVKKDFLLGTTPTWSDIHYELDAPRNITTGLFNLVEDYFVKDIDIKTIAILGSAGSGKSTVLKRLCFKLVQNGRPVYFSHSETLPNKNDFVNTIEMFNERVIIAIDNAELVLRQLVDISKELNKIKFPPIFILASRTNNFDRKISQYDPLINLEMYEMENLKREEILLIIEKLDQNNLLGKLKGLPQNLRIREFENKAKKQILVAMREVTQGEDFDVIIKSEFSEIPTEEAKLLCLCTSLATEAGFTISKQDFISFSSLPPAEALEILEKSLKGVVLKVGVKDDKIMIRHRMIANYFIDSCSKPESLKQAYIRVLSSLASEINTTTRNSRKFELYKQIINHTMIYRRFSKEIDKAREVYESLTEYFRDDYQFWLQYGSLELEGVGGRLEIAENYLNQALSLNNVPIVRKSLANLFYKKALIAASKTEADNLKEKADVILIDLIRSPNPYSSSYHIYGKGNYNYIIHWISDRDEIKNSLKELQLINEKGCESFQNDRSLKTLKDIIQKSILLTAVNGPVKYPILYSEFEK